jgi:hypothetical protein
MVALHEPRPRAQRRLARLARRCAGASEPDPIRRRCSRTGAGAGLIIGAAAGSGAARSSQLNAQQRFDHAFQQCMYAKGHKVPVEGYALPQRTSRRGIPPPPPPKP